MKFPKQLKYYEAFGVVLREHVASDYFRCDCIFCGKELHFYVNPRTGFFDCKRCGVSGGKFKFLERVHGAFAESYNASKYLSKFVTDRQIPNRIFRTYNVNTNRDKPIFPVYDEQNRIIDLRVYNPKRGNWYSTPTCKVGLLGLQKLKKEGPIFLVEGEWDLLSLAGLLAELDEKASVLGVPGAGIFKNEWKSKFAGRKVYICYDNDKAGKAGISKVETKLTGSIATIKWPSGKPKGYDVNDFIRECRKRKIEARVCFEQLIGFCGSEITSKKRVIRLKKNLPRPLSTEIVDQCSEYLDLNDNLVNAIYLSLATVASIQVPGPDPTWLFLVGPPGCGKTTILNLFRDSNQCYFQSSLKSTTLVSGFKDPDGGDPSLIPKLNKKCLILKDFTEITRKPQQERDDLFGVLCGGYDGHVERDWGNGRVVRYESMWTTLSGVTQDILRISNEAFGERFLKYNIQTENVDWKARQKAAMHQALYGKDIKAKISKLVTRFIDHNYKLNEKKLRQLVPSWFTEKVSHLTALIGNLRTSIARHDFGYHRDEPIYIPDKEPGTRPAVQMQRLGVALALVQGKEEIDSDIYNLLAEVGFNSVPRMTLDIMSVVNRNGQVYSSKAISEKIGRNKYSLDKYLDDLVLLDLLEKRKKEKTYTYSPSKAIKSLWKNSVKI